MTALTPSPEQIAAGFRLALDAADRFVGATAPNPPVGCAVLAADGTVLTVAAHEAAGGPHAEAAALAACHAAGRLEAVHTLVATLEPCTTTAIPRPALRRSWPVPRALSGTARATPIPPPLAARRGWRRRA